MKRLGLVVVVAAAAAVIGALLVDGARSAGRPPGLIAFTRADGVYVMRADGSGVRLLWRTGLWAASVSWSPDGRKLAFSDYDGEIWVVGADGSGPVRVAAGSAVSRPSWSPDGRQIAFAAYAAGRRGIWIVNADGSGTRRLATPRLGRIGVFDVDWSPAGGRLAFTSAGWLGQIYVMDTNGGNVRNLTPERAWVYSTEPDWSPDGRRIAFTHARPWRPPPAQQQLSAENEEIWIMDADGRSRTRLTDNHVPDHSPAWSPDGGKIAFVGAYAGRNSAEIYVIGADGTGFTRLTHNHVGEASPTWQPVASS